MGFGVSKDVIEDIRARCDIVELIGSFVPLKRAGTNTYKGLCPFHQEKTPSFHVDAARQTYHCFGCGKGGDVFRFYMDKENVGFSDALHMLASRVGVVIPESSGSGDPAEGRKRASERERLYQINEDFCCFFQRMLIENPNSPATQYLIRRGIPRDVAEKFRIGAVPDEWTACLEYGRSLGYGEDELVTSGIIRRKEETGRCFDHFKGRLAFAITNEQGRVVGFSARSLEAKPLAGGKYINTPESPIFKKGNLLYALPLARKMMVEKDMAILCEGQLDTIAFHRAGYECAVAPQGTGFTENQARVLKRYTSRIYLAFDADSAGQKAILRAVEILLPLSMEIKVIRIPGGKDPDELFANGGSGAVFDAVEQAVSWLEILCASLPERYDMESPSGRGRAAGEVAGYLNRVVNQVELELYIQKAAAALRVSEDALYAELRQVHARERRNSDFVRPEPEAAPAAGVPEAVSGTPGFSSALLTLLELAVNCEDMARRLAEELTPEELAGTGGVEKALNLAIGAALNGEHGEIPAALALLLIETPIPEVSRVLVEHREFADPGKALEDSLAQLRRERRKESRMELMAQLRTAPPEARMVILEKISKLNER